jgi:hypothetical protein
MTGWPNALTAALSLMAAVSGQGISGAAMQGDDTDWWHLCREADEHAKKKRETSRLREVVEAPEATVEALMYSLREGGVKALEEPDTRRRLSQLNDRQLVEVGDRLQRLKPHIACPWTTDEVNLLIRTKDILDDGRKTNERADTASPRREKGYSLPETS